MLPAVLRLSSRRWHIRLARSLTTLSTLHSCSGPRYRMPNDRNQLCVQKLHTSALLNKRRINFYKKTQRSDTFNAFKHSVQNNEVLQMSAVDWAKLREAMLNEDPSFKDGMDFTLMRLLRKRPDLALSLHNYLESINELYSEARSEFMSSCVEDYEDIVLKDLDLLLKDKNVYHSLSAGAFDAVLKTKEWKKAILVYNLLEKNESSRKVHFSALKIGLAAIDHKDFATAFQFLKKYCDFIEANVYKISNEIFNRFITKQISFDVFLEFLKMPNLYLPLEHSLDFIDVCER